MALLAPPDQVAEAYDCLAPFYDRFTDGYAYERWIDAIEERAHRLGLRGSRVLDVACGSGKSSAPFLTRGYQVVGCDISEQMIAQAKQNFPDHTEAFLVADMRQLPALGEFDLVVCLDDALNYLLTKVELESTFAGIARALSPGGILVFDLNSLRTYRSSFAETAVREGDEVFFAWRGEGSAAFAVGDLAAARVEIFAERNDGLWERHSMCHVQRHHPPSVVRAALERAGLQCAAIAGQHPGAQLEDVVDDERHIKLVYFARHPTRAKGGDL